MTTEPSLPPPEMQALLDAQAQLRASEQRFRDLLSLSSEWYWEQDRELRYTFFSSGHFEQYADHSHNILGKLRWEVEHIFGVSAAQWQAHRETLEARLPFQDFVYQIRTPAGDSRWISISGKPVFDDNGEFAGYHGVGSDISERMLGVDGPSRTTNFDPLTGLPNRRLLIDRMEQTILRAQRDGRRAALLLFDLDSFERINDAHGFATGDEILLETARRLRRTVRKSDTVARLGGDKFAVVLPTANTDADLATVAGKILEALRTPFAAVAGSFPLAGSIGIASSPDNAERVEHLLHEAETALGVAKRAGGATYRFASDAALLPPA